MKISKTEVFGFKSAIRGMRNPLNSWEYSDSITWAYRKQPGVVNYNIEGFELGSADMELAQRLVKGGSEHRKFLRQIWVWVDFSLPRFIWAEFDTYKFNTKNSCSTMHTAHKRLLKQSDFENPISESTLFKLNTHIRRYRRGVYNGEEFIQKFKNDLPEGFLQTRTVNINYEELLNIYLQRRNHRLPQWHVICEWILSLPYFKELTGVDNL